MGQGASKYRLLLVGITGSGKSSLGNAILGTDAFAPGHTMRSKTKTCSLRTAKRKNIDLEVVDTPGFCDLELTDDEIQNTIALFLGAVSPGPHAVLIVMSANQRHTEDVDKAYKEAKKLLGDHNLASRIVLVFTRGDIIRKNNVNFDDEMKKPNGHMKEMMSDAGERYVLFDNTETDKELMEQQLATLLTRVNEACMPDFTFLSSTLQKNIETIISNESKTIAKNKNISVDEAHYKVREVLAMDQAQRSDKDKELQLAVHEVLLAVMELIKTAMKTQERGAHDRRCTLL